MTSIGRTGITSLNLPVTARADTSGKYGVFQVFLVISDDSLSVAYRPVSAGLRYGCGELSGQMMHGKRLCDDRRRIVLAMDAIFETVFLWFKTVFLPIP